MAVITTQYYRVRGSWHQGDAGSPRTNRKFILAWRGVGCRQEQYDHILLTNSILSLIQTLVLDTRTLCTPLRPAGRWLPGLLATTKGLAVPPPSTNQINNRTNTQGHRTQPVVVQWSEHSTPTTVSRVRSPDRTRCLLDSSFTATRVYVSHQGEQGSIAGWGHIWFFTHVGNEIDGIANRIIRRGRNETRRRSIARHPAGPLATCRLTRVTLRGRESFPLHTPPTTLPADDVRAMQRGVVFELTNSCEGVATGFKERGEREYTEKTHRTMSCPPRYLLAKIHVCFPAENRNSVEVRISKHKSVGLGSDGDTSAGGDPGEVPACSDVRCGRVSWAVHNTEGHSTDQGEQSIGFLDNQRTTAIALAPPIGSDTANVVGCDGGTKSAGAHGVCDDIYASEQEVGRDQMLTGESDRGSQPQHADVVGDGVGVVVGVDERLPGVLGNSSRLSHSPAGGPQGDLEAGYPARTKKHPTPVSTHKFEMREPPQRPVPPRISIACQGSCPWAAAVPLTMRSAGFTYTLPASSEHNPLPQSLHYIRQISSAVTYVDNDPENTVPRNIGRLTRWRDGSKDEACGVLWDVGFCSGVNGIPLLGSVTWVWRHILVDELQVEEWYMETPKLNIKLTGLKVRSAWEEFNREFQGPHLRFDHLNTSEMNGWGKWEIPEKTHWPASFSGKISTCENTVTRSGIEPSSHWWEVSRLTVHPQQSKTCRIDWRDLAKGRRELAVTVVKS
ncbi:hypothetical protein PR048_005220 [Dryococelus australis]|uniref:Uncharacterized protein n=1 Tax=Dryococelus australis TaxID=614101 RepID=A0ABQ9I7K1_9NEOP|nr:hypothetical protein PR048_005220 [Dryococelus australis]